MCGLYGIYSNHKDIVINQLYDSINAINHRGPDNTGIWINDTNDIGFKNIRFK